MQQQRRPVSARLGALILCRDANRRAGRLHRRNAGTGAVHARACGGGVERELLANRSRIMASVKRT